MKTILGIVLILIGGVIGLSRVVNWVTWSSQQWALYTRGQTAMGILRWLMYELVFAVIWGGMIYLGVKLL